MDKRTLSLPSPATDEDEDPRPFDPWRYAKTTQSRALVEDALDMVDAYERAACPRLRARKPADQATFKETLERVISDVAHLHLSRPPGGAQRIQISRSKGHLSGPKRYCAPAHNEQLPKVLDLLSGAGLIDQFLGDRSGYRLVFTGEFGEMRERRKTTIVPTRLLRTLIADCGITFHDIGHFEGGELIILKEPRKGHWHSPIAIDYEDTAETGFLRSQMARLNAYLAAADISYEERYEGELQFIDVADRYLRRVFTCGDFSHGGRLAGGFWMNLPRELRLSRLRIDGEPVVSLDFSSMNPRLLYAREGVTPPMDDLYRFEGLESYRGGMKRLFNALLFDVRPRFKKPRRTDKETREGLELFPPGISIQTLIQILTTTHEPIAHHFGTGIGHALQFIESTILMEVLRRLEERGISVLPVHDCVVVPRSKVVIAREVMEEATRDVAGIAIPVKEEVVVD